MDQYVSVYIGRPLMIYENDYDTDLSQLTQASLCPSHHLIFQPGLRLFQRSGRSQLQWTIGFFCLWSSCLMFQPVCPALYVLFFFSLTLYSLSSLAGILSSIMRVVYVVQSFPTTSSGTCSSKETKKQVTILKSILNE